MRRSFFWKGCSRTRCRRRRSRRSRCCGSTATCTRARCDGLVNLYHKLSPGGTLIADDYYLFEAQRKAVDEFRAAHGIADPIVQIDHFGGYWIKDQARGQ